MKERSLQTPAHVRIVRPNEELPASWGASIVELENRVWPPKSPDGMRTLALAQERWARRRGIHCLIANPEEPDGVVAHSFIFRRDVLTASGSLGLGALASVCVEPTCRGHGWGADIVRAAFSVLPELGVEVSLFQTGVPHFYERLGCRVVTNCFINGIAENKSANPFWNDHIMIYPASFAWPEDTVDINGEGY